jgi:glycosyltransferase involved in cell wall biosynthesis
MTKVLHIITGLNPGGAEHVLLNLVSHLNDVEHKVIALTSIGEIDLSPKFKERGIQVVSLGMNPKNPFSFLKIKTLVQLIKQYSPQVVQCWMYHGNLVGGLAAYWAKHSQIYWNIRNGALEGGEGCPLPWMGMTNGVVRMGGWLSKVIPHKIIYCAFRTQEIHHQWGYQGRREEVIQNGIDLKRFTPNRKQRDYFRKQWGVEEGIKIIAFLGRYHPQKDLTTLFKAFREIMKCRDDVLLALGGNGLTKDNKFLVQSLNQHGIREKTLLTGPVDSPGFLNTIDVLSMNSSYGEAFPNVVGESLAVGTPCVVTDVGDGAQIVGDAQKVCKPGDHLQLAKNILRVLEQEHDPLALRKRIEENFGISKMIEAYRRIYKEII